MYTPSNPHESLFGTLSHEDFLRQYWQKKPLFISSALANFSSPIDPDELAGLACEAEVESRIVLENAGESPWALENGPFLESRFAQLPATHWTLLVQECNKHVPELADLLERFNFIPHWRVDDVMVSYAPDQGSVGPHIDQYDVFLLQAQGTRRWQISSDTIASDNFLADTDLRIIKEFNPTDEWIAAPGDLLYLPPGVAHYGVAQEDCITLSIGFRSLQHNELITAYVDHLLSKSDFSKHYTDADLELQQHPGEISPVALKKIRQIIIAALNNDEHNSNESIDRWFAQFITESPSEHQHFEPEEPLDVQDFVTQFKTNKHLIRNPDIRFAFIRNKEKSSLFINGQYFPLAADLDFVAALLCDNRRYHYDDLKQTLNNISFIQLLTELYNHGYITFKP